MLRKFYVFTCIVGVGCLLTYVTTVPSGESQSETASTRPASTRYEQRTPSPDGIGKFYMGREISQVMGHQGAEWLERPEREREEMPNRLVELLKLKEGMLSRISVSVRVTSLGGFPRKSVKQAPSTVLKFSRRCLISLLRRWQKQILPISKGS